MDKFSKLVLESTKKDFNKNVIITLDNGLKIETNINVVDLNEAFAKNQIIDLLSNKSIVNIEYK